MSDSTFAPFRLAEKRNVQTRSLRTSTPYLSRHTILLLRTFSHGKKKAADQFKSMHGKRFFVRKNDGGLSRACTPLPRGPVPTLRRKQRRAVEVPEKNKRQSRARARRGTRGTQGQNTGTRLARCSARCKLHVRHALDPQA